MDKEEQDDLRLIKRFIASVVIMLLIIGGVSTVTSRLFDLAWFPWDVKMKTGMIRASNSYVTTQQTALRELRTGYEYADTDGQKLALVRQMHQIADTIPDDVPPDVRAFLGSR